jgi:tetratricopeptide (TPR) repeat protein
MDLDPSAAEPNFLMGQTYDKLDRPQRAVTFYDKAIKLDPSMDDAYYFLAKAYAKSGDAAQAVRYFQDYLNRNPPQARAQEVAREIKRLGGGG